MTPLVGNRGIIVKVRHFYSSMCELLNIFVEPHMLLTIYLANPCAILRTINQGHHQHAKEQYLS
jgi:hypothetical protein